jgi:competence protein ComEA
MTPSSPRSTSLGGSSWGCPSQTGLTRLAVLLALGLLFLSSRHEPDGLRAEAPDLVVDPNTAPAEVLSALPKVGPVLLRHLIAARQERPFESLDDMDRRVRGIGPATLAALRPHLRIGPSRAP